MIKINLLEKTYKAGKRQAIKALRGVSLDFPDKGMIFILGKSGSGKSTLLNLLGGLDRPSGGEVVIDGRSSKDFTDRDYDAFRNKYVGFVFQDYNLIDRYTVGSNIALSLELQDIKADRQTIDDVLVRLELTETDGKTLYDRKINELSGGQKQRVAIARALIKNPKLILADEPTGALDSETGEALYGTLKALSDEKLVIVVTHDKDAAERYGDRIVELKDGIVLSDRFINSSAANDVACVPQENKIYSPGKLPIKRVLTMGLEGLRYKKIRMIISMILAVVSFAAFGFFLVSATADPLTAELKIAYEKGIKTVLICGDSTHTSLNVYDDDRFASNELEGMYSQKLQDEQLTVLKKSAVLMPYWDYDTIKFDNYFSDYYARGYSSVGEKYNPYNYFRKISARYVELDPDSGESDAALTPDPRLTAECRLPRTFEEIALTDYQADMFIRFGYKDVDGDGTISEINHPDDLIGKTLWGMTVCGIYNTDDERSWFRENYDKDGNIDYSYIGTTTDDYFFDDYIYTWMQGAHSMENVFVRSGFYKDISGLDPNVVGYNSLYKLSGNIAKDKALLYSLRFDKEEEPRRGPYVTKYRTIHYDIKLETGYSGFAKKSAFLRNENFILIMIYCCIGLAVFSALILTNFLLTGLDVRKHTIGILRALGARRKDIVRICLAESMSVAMINYIVSLLGIGGLCIVFNSKFVLPLFVLGIIPVVFLTLLCFGTAALASIFPVIRIMKRKPIEIINQKV